MTSNCTPKIKLKKTPKETNYITLQLIKNFTVTL